MKTLLRACALAAALVLGLLAGHAKAAGLVTCNTTCTSPSGTSSRVTWTTSASQCCAETPNPCPAGTSPTFSSYRDSSGLHACPSP